MFSLLLPNTSLITGIQQINKSNLPKYTTNWYCKEGTGLKYSTFNTKYTIHGKHYLSHLAPFYFIR